MGLFDKKICDICGEKIGLLGNRKLDDGNLCKDCAKKLSPWFEDRRHSTVEDIKRQLEYREKNKKAVMDFCITRQINTRNYNVFIDDNKGNFTVARKLDVNENPDIVPLSAIVQCRVDVERQQNEETYTTKDGLLYEQTASHQRPGRVRQGRAQRYDPHSLPYAVRGLQPAYRAGQQHTGLRQV